MPRVAHSASLALAAGTLTILAIAACGPERSTTGGAVPPPPPAGYDDLRVLSRDDCVALRDHQIEIAVAAALEADGGSAADVGARLVLEAELRKRTKGETEAWLKRCSGRTVPASDLRCMRESTAPEAFNACGSDVGGDAAPDGPVDALSAASADAGGG
jgi:hypothetical protein